ncbi:cell division protein FtsQ/DivIB [Joostella sp. CR20]|uniref:cell division protein FtsQ/DivIB n=1 Tax=Joostella sp. CR20 TaxID=2804312 RepID=UPI00313C35FB
MKKYVNHIKIIIALIAFVSLYSFSNRRNENRVLSSNCKIEFLNDDAHYITRNTVNKLLIQNSDSVTMLSKEKLALNNIEESLNANAMVQAADVYVSITGEIGAKIRQRTPIARVAGNQSFYIDKEGKKMPLSPVHSARVPLVTGVGEKDAVDNLYKLAMFINNDEFLTKNIIGIHQNKNQFELKLRTEDFIVNLGEVKNLQAKFNNFKAFYQKGLHDKTLNAYKRVNLEFDNQVVCTKK